MHPTQGPRQPVPPYPNGTPDYELNPMEDLPIKESAGWEDSNIAADYMTEPVFSSRAFYGITGETPHQPRH